MKNNVLLTNFPIPLHQVPVNNYQKRGKKRIAKLSSGNDRIIAIAIDHLKIFYEDSAVNRLILPLSGDDAAGAGWTAV